MLPPGPYHIEVALSGFARWENDSLTLQVGQDHALDVQLALAGVKEDVVVRGENRVLTTAMDGVIASDAVPGCADTGATTTGAAHRRIPTIAATMISLMND
jgi:hypothetical protein